MLKVVPVNANPAAAASSLLECRSEALDHHEQLISGYLQSHRIRNHADKTIHDTKRLLTAWFSLHGREARPLLTWEAMAPVSGRKRVVEYGKTLLASDVSVHTVRNYFGILRGFFSYVMEHPYVFDGDNPKRISDLYGPIEQPVSEFDMPVHVYNGETLGVPFDPARLYEFYAAVRSHYLKAGHNHTRARNYAMAVIAGESGLRSDEVSHLETKKDLFFDSRKLQTRHAKATRGSGKRSRVTLFTPLARDTIRYYLKHHRPFLCVGQSPYLFPTKVGGPVPYNSMLGGLREIKKSVNETGFSVGDHMSWHWFRRLFATRFIERFPHQLSVLVELLGHVTPNTVHTYIRHSDAWTDRKIIEVLEGRGTDRDPMEA